MPTRIFAPKTSYHQKVCLLLANAESGEQKRSLSLDELLLLLTAALSHHSGQHERLDPLLLLALGH